MLVGGEPSRDPDVALRGPRGVVGHRRVGAVPRRRQVEHQQVLLHFHTAAGRQLQHVLGRWVRQPLGLGEGCAQRKRRGGRVIGGGSKRLVDLVRDVACQFTQCVLMRQLHELRSEIGDLILQYEAIREIADERDMNDFAVLSGCAEAQLGGKFATVTAAAGGGDDVAFQSADAGVLREECVKVRTAPREQLLDRCAARFGFGTAPEPPSGGAERPDHAVMAGHDQRVRHRGEDRIELGPPRGEPLVLFGRPDSDVDEEDRDDEGAPEERLRARQHGPDERLPLELHRLRPAPAAARHPLDLRAETLELVVDDLHRQRDRLAVRALSALPDRRLDAVGAARPRPAVLQLGPGFRPRLRRLTGGYARAPAALS